MQKIAKYFHISALFPRHWNTPRRCCNTVLSSTNSVLFSTVLQELRNVFESEENNEEIWPHPPA